MSPERAARRMLDLLSVERRAARAGDVERLMGLAGEKERLAAAIEAGVETGARPSEATMRRLSAALDETQPLLKASLDGIRAARERLEARDAPFRTYGPDGTTGTIDTRPPGPVRRA